MKCIKAMRDMVRKQGGKVSSRRYQSHDRGVWNALGYPQVAGKVLSTIIIA